MGSSKNQSFKPFKPQTDQYLQNGENPDEQNHSKSGFLMRDLAQMRGQNNENQY